MFQRNYTVKGEDVNDFMVMQNAAFLKYASKLFDTFLFVNGFAKLKMNTLKVGLHKSKDTLEQQHKYLMFTQPFSIQLDFKEIESCNKKMFVDVQFFNNKKELCAVVKRELFWFDYSTWQVITPPKKILKHFTKTAVLQYAS
ncbi:thioesterase family protein [uncultured Polaribacter sp.]|uniref:thioesterase family protein n=1 Tax=uncultured Polaribacter sp. TaxID=174711 RepID=UPI00260A8D03|nr:thioesterase family protein [uncultured Polaribacter sp.]